MLDRAYHSGGVSLSLQRRAICTHGRSGLAYVRALAYLLGFAALLASVSHYYLLPALEAAGQATPRERRLLSAHSLLILAILLVILLAGLILTFRIGRFFRPRQQNRQTPTRYPDAWAESARRVRVDGNEADDAD